MSTHRFVRIARAATIPLCSGLVALAAGGIADHGPTAATAQTSGSPAPPSHRWWKDADGDGTGAYYVFLDSATQPSGYVKLPDDCDDADYKTHPLRKTDPAGTGDDDCDGVADEDRIRTFYFDGDGDGFGLTGKTTSGVTVPAGYAARFGDCRDDTIHITAFDCNADNDGDGHTSVYRRGDDCDDFEARRYPGRTEALENGLDDDCNPNTRDVIPRDPNFLLPGH